MLQQFPQAGSARIVPGVPARYRDASLKTELAIPIVKEGLARSLSPEKLGLDAVVIQIR